MRIEGVFHDKHCFILNEMCYFITLQLFWQICIHRINIH